MLVHFTKGNKTLAFMAETLELVDGFCAMNTLGDFCAEPVSRKYKIVHERTTYGFANKSAMLVFQRSLSDRWFYAPDWKQNILDDAAVVKHKDLFKAVIRKAVESGELPRNCSVVMGDNSRGAAYKHLFPVVPKRPFTFTLEDGSCVRVSAHVSTPYINGRHNTKVRHVTAAIQTTKKKKISK